MHPALEERFPAVEELEAERFAAKDDYLLIHYRIKRSGRWRHEQHPRLAGVERMKELALDTRYDRLGSELLPASAVEVPAEFGGGTVDYSKPSLCPECGEFAGECASWCSLARSGR